MRTNCSVRKVPYREGNKTHQRSLGTRGCKCRVKVEYADDKCARMHKRAKWEIDRLVTSHINIQAREET